MQTQRAVAAVAALLFALGLVSQAEAGRKRKNRTYYYEVTQVKLAEGTPDAIGKQVEAQLRERIAAHDALLDELPEAAPDPDEKPKKFKRYLKRKNLGAHKVNVEVTRYEHRLEPNPRKRGQILTVSIELRIFGETIPDRVMAFTGDGSATVKLEIGRKLRERDSEAGNHDAIELSIDKALAESIRKLRRGPPKRKKRKK